MNAKYKQIRHVVVDRNEYGAQVNLQMCDTLCIRDETEVEPKQPKANEGKRKKMYRDVNSFISI